MTKVDFSKFANNFSLVLIGTTKSSYKDDFEKGESIDGVHSSVDHLNVKFNLTGNETREELTELALNYFRDTFYDDRIDQNWVTDYNSIIGVSVSEDADGNTVDAKKQWDMGLDVYSCYYYFNAYINGVKLDTDDVWEMFDFRG